jgi:2-succinyl-5-enolpyruvyl-6-hydroxy-3-cyclohexene-1-carboxylate synthase
MYGATFTRIESWEEFRTVIATAVTSDGTTVVEVPVSRKRNLELHHSVWKAVENALAESGGGAG